MQSKIKTIPVLFQRPIKFAPALLALCLLACGKHDTPQSVAPSATAPTPESTPISAWQVSKAQSTVNADNGTKYPYQCMISIDMNMRSLMKQNDSIGNAPSLGITQVSDNTFLVNATSLTTGRSILTQGAPVWMSVERCQRSTTDVSVDMSKPFAGYKLVTTGRQLDAYYYSVADMAVPYDKLASTFMQSYRNEPDAFRKQDLSNQFQSGFDAEVADAKANPYASASVLVTLGHYDATTKGFTIQNFPLNGTASIDRNDDPTVNLTFQGNAKLLQYVPANETEARDIEQKLSKDSLSQIHLTVYGKIAGIGDDNRIRPVIMKVIAVEARNNQNEVMFVNKSAD